MAKKQSPVKIKKIQREYEKQLSKVAKQVGRIVNRYPPNDPSSPAKIDRALREYADSITEWATSVAMSVINAVDREDRRAWKGMLNGSGK